MYFTALFNFFNEFIKNWLLQNNIAAFPAFCLTLKGLDPDSFHKPFQWDFSDPLKIEV